MKTNDILKKIEESREKYKPNEIKTVIVAEAPPDSIERFFYYESVNEADYLFIGIMKVLYPDAIEKYKISKRNPKIKELILQQFQEDGFYLLDLFELPLTLNTDNEIVAVKKLISKLENCCSSKTPIILVKVNVYDFAYEKLKQKFNVINKRIEFPSTGNQIKFHEKFEEVINKYISF